MPPAPVVEGRRVDALPSDTEAVQGRRLSTSEDAAVALPIGPWADLGVSSMSTTVPDVEALLPTAVVRSDEADARDDREERKIKFLATLSPWQRWKLLWWHKSGFYRQ